MKARLSHMFGEAPLGFIGAVIAIAVVFRLGIGVMKPSVQEPELEAPVALHTPPPESPKAVAKAESKPAAAPIVTDALPTVEATPAVTATAKKKSKPPRSFGKR